MLLFISSNSVIFARVLFKHSVRNIVKKIIAVILAIACLIYLSACYLVVQPCQFDAIAKIVAENLCDEDSMSFRPPVEAHEVFVAYTGDRYYQMGDITVDISHVSNGYVKVRHKSYETRAIARITKPDAEFYYVFALTMRGEWDTFLLTHGDGEYSIKIFENVRDGLFALAFDLQFVVTFCDPFVPFLHPSQHVNFDSDSLAVIVAGELAEGAESELDVIRNIYRYVINNIEYDFDLARQISDGYISSHIPDVDRTLKTGFGICFDFASLMTAMLRSQHIPARLEVGIVNNELKHAWVSVYINGFGWHRVDPTFSATAGNSFIANKPHTYLLMFTY